MKEHEERSDEGMWSGKFKVRMTSTTTVDCSGKNTRANNLTYPSRKAQEKCREDNNETQRTPTPVF
jgi:hypothetical protein